MYAKRFSQVHWTFLGLGDENKWFGNRNYKPGGKWNSVASQMVPRFKERGHPVFTGAGALSRAILTRLKRKRNQALQCGFFEHSTLIPNHSLSKSAQYVRSRLKLG